MGEINAILEKFNPFVPNALFLYPLKTSEGRERVHGNEWINTCAHPNNQQALCQKQIKYLREESSSNNLIIKILSENKSAFKECLLQQSKSYEAYYHANVTFIDPKKTIKFHKKKNTPHNF